MSRRLTRNDSSVGGSESGDSRYDFGPPDVGLEYRQHYLYLTRDRTEDGQDSDFESSESGDSKEMSPRESFEATEDATAEDYESQAVISALAHANADAVNQISTGLMRRIASKLSISSPGMLDVEALKGTFESPLKAGGATHDLEINDEVASAAADLERCIQVLQPHVKQKHSCTEYV